MTLHLISSSDSFCHMIRICKLTKLFIIPKKYVIIFIEIIYKVRKKFDNSDHWVNSVNPWTIERYLYSAPLLPIV